MEAVKEEVERLKWAGAIREVFFSRVAVKYDGGKNEKWEMESLC